VSSNPPERRVLLVHAHPDDETIGTGATMAKHVAAGDGVTLVTCTLGEEGEILVPELANLASDRDDALGEHRIGELNAAMAALGVTDHRFLGGLGRWRDSGMMGTPTNDNPECFWRADLDEAVGELVKVIREVRPQVVIGYDANGGYGHPDHIQVHRVTAGGFEAAGDPSRYPDAGEPWAPSELGEEAPFGVVSPDDLTFGTPDELVTTAIDARDCLPAKIEAMRAYPTQISVDGQFFALSNDVGQGAFGIEYFRLVAGPAPADGEQESDLFAGLRFA
jgi:N-acetyl-1-D-myo-inositol-2-amino-2-deoxy-alpha-D-glucopyranoside deacetylase